MQSGIECLHCGAETTFRGKPLSFLPIHLRKVDGIDPPTYAADFPDAPQFSAEYSALRSRIANEHFTPAVKKRLHTARTQQWQELLSAFRPEGYLSVHEAAGLLGISRQAILAAINRQSIVPDVCVSVDTSRTHMPNFYLLHLDTVMQYAARVGR